MAVIGLQRKDVSEMYLISADGRIADFEQSSCEEVALCWRYGSWLRLLLDFRFGDQWAWSRLLLRRYVQGNFEDDDVLPSPN